VLGSDRVLLARDVAIGLQVATALAKEAGDDSEPLVVVTGSVVTVGDATRALSAGRDREDPRSADGSARAR
jgi:hypothetical protein